MRIVELAAALCLTAALTACATPQPVRSAATETTTANNGSSQLVSGDSKFGEPQTWEGGLSVTVSPPRSLTPSDTAFPPSPRAAVFEVTIDNRSPEVYKPALLLVKATAAGQTAVEIVDPAQGLNGIVSGAQDVPPGKTLRLTAAFAVPAQLAAIEVTVQPETGTRYSARHYVGQA